jgi:hypothetical protein
MITERAIINFLIITASFVLVPFVIFSSLTVDYLPALLFGGAGGIVGAFFILKDRLCFCPLLATAIAGSLNFLPLGLQSFHVACIMLILYYVTGYVAIRQNQIKLGKTMFLWPILIITGIVIYHNHSLSLHVMNSETEGSKPAILLFLVVLAYFCGINVSAPSLTFISKVPFYYLVLTFISSIPFFLTTVIPSLAPYVYSVSGNVNVDAYVDTQASPDFQGGGAIGRLAAFGPVGGALQLYLLCHYPIGTWLRPNRWWVAILWVFCAILAVSSGYRNVLFTFATVAFVGTWAYYSYRSLILPVALFVGLLVITVVSSDNIIQLPLDKLPIIAQRTLSFLPGEWDPEAKESAKASNEFRENIQKVYIDEYMANSPIFGNGFNIDTDQYNQYREILLHGANDDGYTQAKVFIIGKIFHTGWLSVYDAVGLVGMLAFIVLGWNEIVVSARFVMGAKANRQSILFPLYVWLLCNIVTMMIGYFTVFGDFGQTFMNLCIYGIVLTHLAEVENAADVPIPLKERQGMDYRLVNGTLTSYGDRAGRYR